MLRQLVDDPLVPILGVGHEVYRHGADQVRDLPAAGQHFRVLIETRISARQKRSEQLLTGYDADGAVIPLRLCCRLLCFFLFFAHSFLSPHQSLAFVVFSRSSRYPTAAKTDASNRSIRCSGCIFSYWIMSSVFSTAATFCTQYS